MPPRCHPRCHPRSKVFEHGQRDKKHASCVVLIRCLEGVVRHPPDGACPRGFLLLFYNEVRVSRSCFVSGKRNKSAQVNYFIEEFWPGQVFEWMYVRQKLIRHASGWADGWINLVLCYSGQTSKFLRRCHIDRFLEAVSPPLIRFGEQMRWISRIIRKTMFSKGYWKFGCFERC